MSELSPRSRLRSNLLTLGLALATKNLLLIRMLACGPTGTTIARPRRAVSRIEEQVCVAVYVKPRDLGKCKVLTKLSISRIGHD